MYMLNLNPKLIFGLIVILASSFRLNAEKPLVVATASMIADMAKEIGGDVIEVESIVPIGGDPHLHEPTPRDARLCTQAQVILRNGLTFEGWLDELIANSNTKASIITVTDGIEPISSLTYKNSADPHAWMDASLVKNYYATNIKNALLDLLPNEHKYIVDRFDNFVKRLSDLDIEVMNSIKKIPKASRILITSHDAFQYFGRRYDIRLEAILGTSTDAEVQTADIVRLNKVIKESAVPAVFIESTINPKLLQQIAKDNKIKVGGKLYADSIGDEDSPASTYIEMLRYNTNTIVNALSQKEQDTPSKTEDMVGESINWLTYVFIGLTMIAALLGVVFFASKRT